jgi:lipopolysaccharide/colanic/teichoic acid biosynthesis glycosyltransferase
MRSTLDPLRRGEGSAGPAIAESAVEGTEIVDTRAIGTLRARLAVNFLTAELAPALALGALAYARLGNLSIAVAGAGIALFLSSKLRPFLQSSALMPLASFIARIAPVGLGALAILLLCATDESAAANEVPAIALGAYLALAIGGVVWALFRRARPLRAAIIGTEEMAGALATELGSTERVEYLLVGRIDPAEMAPAVPSAVPCIGTVATIRQSVIEHGLDLLICAPRSALVGSSRQQIFEGAAACLDLPIRLIDGEEAYETILGHVPLAVAGPFWFGPMLHPRHGWGYDSLARARDVLLTILVAPFALILLAVCAAAIAISDGLPIFHRQRRIGARGEEFTVTKLRSMRDDIKGDQWWAQEDDPRVTPIGRFLRRSHLDELPQLWNVFKGEMSLVGPRPEVPAIVDRLEKDFPFYDRRHLVLPGLTGWAQVRCGYAGSASGSAWKLCFDLYYLKHRSFIFDLLIMVETLRVVLNGGQYGLDEPDARFIVHGKLHGDLSVPDDISEGHVVQAADAEAGSEQAHGAPEKVASSIRPTL